MKSILFFLFLFFSTALFSQDTESAKWRYTYDGYAQVRKEKKARPIEMVLDVVGFKSEFYSFSERRIAQVKDSLFAKGAGLAEVLETIRSLGIVRDNQCYTVYKNYPKAGKLLFIEKLLGDYYLYEESLNFPKWKIEAEKKEILGYSCQKASADFLGRKWTVWFAPAIPISDGPWKLGGLPGLILQAEEQEGSYSFRCIGIRKMENEASIDLLKYNYVKCTREEFLKDKLLFLRSVSDFSMRQGTGPIQQLMPDGTSKNPKTYTANYIER